MLDLDTLQYPLLHDVMNITGNEGNIFACDTKEYKDKNDLFKIFWKNTFPQTLLNEKRLIGIQIQANIGIFMVHLCQYVIQW